MFDELENYPHQDHFFLDGRSRLDAVCNAPKKAAGVFLVYKLANGRVQLVYVGASELIGSEEKDVLFKCGLYDQIVYGEHYGQPRHISWKDKIVKEGIDALDIYWYETFHSELQDLPGHVQGLLLQIHFSRFGCLPEWHESY